MASGTDYIEVMLSPRLEMSNVIEWLRLNKLTLNVKKTKLMVFGTQQKMKNIKPVPLLMNNETVDKVDSFKYL